MHHEIENIKTWLDGLKTKPPGAWMILYQGEPIRLPSGKSLWKEKRHATSAFTNHLHDLLRYPRKRELIDALDGEFNDTGIITRYLIKEGIIEIKQL